MVKVFPNQRTKSFITPSPTNSNPNLHYICVYINEDLRTLHNKEKYPGIKIDERYCQIFNTKEELENLIFYGNNLPGIIVRQISTKPFYIFEDGKIQGKYCGNLYYNFIYRFEDTNPDEWIDNPIPRRIDRINFLSPLDFVLKSSDWEKHIK